MSEIAGTETADAVEAVENQEDASSGDESEIGFAMDKNPSAQGLEADTSGVDSDDDRGALEEQTQEIVKQKKKKDSGPYKYDKKIEESLESFLFGNTVSSRVAALSSGTEDESDEADESEATLEKAKAKKVAKRSKHSDSSSSDSSEDDEAGDSREGPKRRRKAAWHDEDDDETLVKDVTASYAKAKGKHGAKETSTQNYADTIRKNFSSMVDTPKWADLNRGRGSDDDSDDEFFRETTDMLEGSKRSEALSKGTLEFRKLKDLNETTHCEGTVIRSAEFHPHSAVALVAGLNGTASLFKVDGKSNPKISTVNFQNFPIRTAHFSSSGDQFFVGSQHFPHFFVYDLNSGKTMKFPWKDGDGQGCFYKFEMSPPGGTAGDLLALHGRFGAIHILSQKSKQKIFTLKMNNHVNAVAFSPDGSLLYSHGAGGEIYIWDLKAQDCLQRFVDDGSIRGTSIAVSKNNRYLAAGSDSGVVNIYNRNALTSTTQANPKPEKVVLNLTTAASNVKFNPTSEILAMGSELKENAVKMVHLPSMTVYQNFPSLNYNIKRPNCIDFSLSGGYMSIGNNRGAANLYRLKHFGNF